MNSNDASSPTSTNDDQQHSRSNIASPSNLQPAESVESLRTVDTAEDGGKAPSSIADDEAPEIDEEETAVGGQCRRSTDSLDECMVCSDARREVYDSLFIRLPFGIRMGLYVRMSYPFAIGGRVRDNSVS